MTTGFPVETTLAVLAPQGHLDAVNPLQLQLRHNSVINEFKLQGGTLQIFTRRVLESSMDTSGKYRPETQKQRRECVIKIHGARFAKYGLPEQQDRVFEIVLDVTKAEQLFNALTGASKYIDDCFKSNLPGSGPMEFAVGLHEAIRVDSFCHAKGTDRDEWRFTGPDGATAILIDPNGEHWTDIKGAVDRMRFE